MRNGLLKLGEELGTKEELLLVMGERGGGLGVGSLHPARGGGCQEIGLVAIMFFFELLFSYVSLAISFYVFLTNLFSIILFLIC